MKLAHSIAVVLIAFVCVAQGSVPTHPLGSLPVHAQVLQEQKAAEKGSKEFLEHHQQTLLKSVDKAQRTRSSVETRCVRERIVLREKLRQTEERVGNTETIAEQLQAENMKLRGEGFQAKRGLDESQREIAVNIFELEHLKESVREVLKRDWPEWAPPMNQPIPKMVAFLVSSLRVENTELRSLVFNLEANLSSTQNQLHAQAAQADRYASARIENSKLRSMVSNLKANLSATQHELHAKATEADHHARVRIENSKLHAKVSNLKANLGATSHQLQEKTAEADRFKRATADAAAIAPMAVATGVVAGGNFTAAIATPSGQENGSDETARALQEQNTELLHPFAANQSEVRELLGQVSGLNDDKARLLASLQSAMSESILLRQEIAQMRKDKDDEIRKMRDDVTEHINASFAKPSISETTPEPPARPIVPPLAQPLSEPLAVPFGQPLSESSSNQVLQNLVSPPTPQPATAADPLLEMADKLSQKRNNVEEMKKLAAAAQAVSSEPLGEPLSAWDVLPEVPHQILKLTKPLRVVSWLGAKSTSMAASMTPVDGLDPETTATAEKAQTLDENEDAEMGDSVAQLLRRAQSVVSDAGAAA